MKDEGKRGEDISRWVPAKPLKYKDGAWIEVEYHWFLDRQDWHDRFSASRPDDAFKIQGLLLYSCVFAERFENVKFERSKFSRT